MERRLLLSGLVSTLLLVGCASSQTMDSGRASPPADPHAGHEGNRESAGLGTHADHAMPDGLTATDGPGYTAADVHFMQMMMGHHAQAVQMSEMVAERDAHPDLRQLAMRIDISQRDEMAFMIRWLEARGQPVPTEAQVAEMRMPGLVSREDMARLEGARGTEFDHLFLELMIHHHLGAISMVDDLFASPRGGQDPDIFQFATDVANDQLDEINVMERIRARLPSPSRSDTP